MDILVSKEKERKKQRKGTKRKEKGNNMAVRSLMGKDFTTKKMKRNKQKQKQSSLFFFMIEPEAETEIDPAGI